MSGLRSLVGEKPQRAPTDTTSIERSIVPRTAAWIWVGGASRRSLVAQDAVVGEVGEAHGGVQRERVGRLEDVPVAAARSLSGTPASRRSAGVGFG